MGRQTSNSEREIIAQTAIERAVDTLRELDNGRWKKSCNPIIKQRIINGIQPLIFAAKKANDIQKKHSESSPLDTIVRLSRENVEEVIMHLDNEAENKTELADKIINIFKIDPKFRFTIFASVFKNNPEKVIDIILSEA